MRSYTPQEGGRGKEVREGGTGRETVKATERDTHTTEEGKSQLEGLGERASQTREEGTLSHTHVASSLETEIKFIF